MCFTSGDWLRGFWTNLLEERQKLYRPEGEHVQQIWAELVHVAQVYLQVRFPLSIPLQELRVPRRPAGSNNTRRAVWRCGGAAMYVVCWGDIS